MPEVPIENMNLKLMRAVNFNLACGFKGML